MIMQEKIKVMKKQIPNSWNSFLFRKRYIHSKIPTDYPQNPWGFITVPIPIPYPYPWESPWESPYLRQPCCRPYVWYGKPEWDSIGAPRPVSEFETTTVLMSRRSTRIRSNPATRNSEKSGRGSDFGIYLILRAISRSAKCVLAIVILSVCLSVRHDPVP